MTCPYIKHNQDKQLSENIEDECVSSYICSAPYPEWIEHHLPDAGETVFNGIDIDCVYEKTCSFKKEILDKMEVLK